MKARTPGILDVVDLHPIETCDEVGVSGRKQPVDAVRLVHGIAISWLIQSHPQTGPASAKSFDKDSNRVCILVDEHRFQWIERLVGELHHLDLL